MAALFALSLFQLRPGLHAFEHAAALTGDFPIQVEDCAEPQLRQLHAASLSVLPATPKLSAATVSTSMREIHAQRVIAPPSTTTSSVLMLAHLGGLAVGASLWLR